MTRGSRSPRRALQLAAAALALAAGGASALPMASQGSVMVMGDFNGGGERELAANYAVTGHDAFGAMAGRWLEPTLHAGEHGVKLVREASALTYTRLVHRWNLPHAQANLWFVGMLGGVRGDDLGGTSTLWSTAVQADYETTRVYAGAGFEPMRGDGVRHDSAWVRAGFSFYEVDYEQAQPWFVVEAKRTRYTTTDETLVTPMLRVIHRRYFVELGANDDGVQLNFMLTY
ncbi:MAG: hypothetical protein MUC32_02900 [Burkholderiaceae bacterium]|nr:hypothetical protein [Burkholderiaceae bacterium]